MTESELKFKIFNISNFKDETGSISFVEVSKNLTGNFNSVKVINSVTKNTLLNDFHLTSSFNFFISIQNGIKINIFNSYHNKEVFLKEDEILVVYPGLCINIEIPKNFYTLISFESTSFNEYSL